MLALVVLFVLMFWFGRRLFAFQLDPNQEIISPRKSARLTKLWNYVQTAFRQNKQKAAERALLSILRIDHKNTAAYNRLGMLYVRQQNYDDALECFEIASSLTPTPATLFNLGLVHFEMGNYSKAAVAFERVIDIDPIPKRLLAYAKVQEKLGEYKKVVSVLEDVVRQEPLRQNMELLAQAYEQAKEFKQAEKLRIKIAQMKSGKNIRNPVQRGKKRLLKRFMS